MCNYLGGERIFITYASFTKKLIKSEYFDKFHVDLCDMCLHTGVWSWMRESSLKG